MNMKLYELSFFNGNGYSTVLEVSKSRADAIIKFKEYLNKKDEFDNNYNWEIPQSAITEIIEIGGYRVLLEKI